MKTFIKTLVFAAALTFLFAMQTRAQDDSSVSFQTFYDQLANQGTWIQSNNYGYVWQPTESDPNWRPYTYGHWVNTEAGMTWVSDESFGWATYHYGRWVNLDGYGWVWVPGYTWAPAWVSWRDGGDDVGWAPLPPDSDVGIDYFNDDDYFTDAFFGFGFHIGGDCDLAFGIGPWCYNFCPVVYIGDRDCWRHFRDRRDNFALINHTRNVTNINFRRDGAGRFDRVHTEGPSVAALNARARTPIEQAQLTSASRPDDAGLHGNMLAVYAPRVDPATATTARPASVGRTLANTSVNRGTDINRPLAVNSEVRPAGPTMEQVHAAALAQNDVAAHAKVATAETRPSRSLTQPLTSLRTGSRSTSIFGTGTRRNAVMDINRSPAPSGYTDSSFTGEPAARQETVAPQTTMPQTTTRIYHTTPSYYSPGESYHPSLFHTSAPLFHSSASVYHPEPSFHSGAPASEPHFSESFHGAPAEHFSSGNFGGGGRSFGGGDRVSGGGGGHASSGGRH